MELEEVKDKLTKTQYNYFLQLYIFKKIINFNLYLIKST